MRIAIALLFAAACTGDCPQDVCTNPDETEHFAGPCRSALSDNFSCDYEYDDLSRMTKIACRAQDPRDPEWIIGWMAWAAISASAFSRASFDRP